MTTADAATAPPPENLPDDVSVRRWFGVFALWLLATGVPLALLAWRHAPDAGAWTDRPYDAFVALPPAVKLLGFALYISLCCTFLPLPTGGVVAAVAMRDVAVGGGLVSTTLLVALVGAAASTLANLDDYHLFTWMLRHRRIGAVRQTKTYRLAAAWFAEAPFFLLLLFNVIPIPVDVIRMLATTYRYPRVPFAAANFLGRLVRYAAIAAGTYALGDRGWLAVAGLFALAAALGLAKLLPRVARRYRKAGRAGTRLLS